MQLSLFDSHLQWNIVSTSVFFNDLTILSKKERSRIKTHRRSYARKKARLKIDPEYKKKETNRQRIRRKKKRHNDPVFAMKKRVGCRIRRSLKSQGYAKQSTTQEILGIDYIGFKEHIERQFVDGMSWENRNRWHIDHIIPLAVAKSEDDIIRLNHYTNMQPLWAEDNISKGAKIL